MKTERGIVTGLVWGWPWRLTGAALAMVGAGVLALLVMEPIPPAAAACSALPTDKGWVTYTLNVPANGTYRVWARLHPTAANNNGIYLQVDQSHCNVVLGHNTAIAANQLTWVDYGNAVSNKVNLSLTKGNHQVILAGYDPNVGVDKVLFLSDTACVPTGTGTNCAAAAPTSTTQPTVVSPLSGGLDPAQPVPDKIALPVRLPDGSTKVYKLDGRIVTGSIDTTKLADGDHILEEITTAPDGTVTTKKTILKIRNGWQYKAMRALQAHPYITGGVLGLLVLGWVASYFLFGPKRLWPMVRARWLGWVQ